MELFELHIYVKYLSLLSVHLRQNTGSGVALRLAVSTLDPEIDTVLLNKQQQTSY